MPLTAVVTPGEAFPDNENITRAKLRNAANPTVQMGGNLSNNEVNPSAAIALSKLEGIEEGQILVGGSSGHAVSKKNIVATQLPQSGANTGGSINTTTGITPSNNTVSHSSLLVNGVANIVRGADQLGKCVLDGGANDSYRTKSACETAGGTWNAEPVASNDVVLLCNVSQDSNSETQNSADNLRKVEVSDLLASTFTTQVEYTDLTTSGGNPAPMTATATKTVNLAGNAIQVINLNDPASGDTYTCNVTYSNGPTTGYAKNVMLVISNSSSKTIDLSFTAPNSGNFWFLNSTKPRSIAPGKLGCLAMTGWPGDKCIAGWAVEP
tara:strand:- start:1691 stop:2662 length:972 start_codon:yes stop_codon:yes gene_type:complete